ncbi:MAG: hypothetical protein M1825_004676 [Sarcosagium campestre]|nr:MAG: hypothetical protein M1825_004676 [Sarcosagium campestre]
MEQDEKDIKKPVIPKFGSFRPKVAPSPTQSDLLSARDSANAILGSNSQKKTPSAQQHGREHGEEHREEASHDRRRYQRQTPRPRSQGRREQADRSTAISVQDTGVTKPDHSESTNLYSVDLKGDPSNLIYGAIHRHSIPTYNRTGSGSITGLPRYLKIDRDSRHNNALVVFDRASFSLGKREKYVFARNERIAARKLRVRQPNASKTEMECSEDFIALRPWHHVSRKRKLSCESLSSAGEGEETESLGGSAEGKDWRSRKALDADLEYVSESSSSDYETVDMTSIDHASRDHGTKLSRRVEDEPSNVEAWLELIKHQDTLLDQRGQNPNRKSTDAERRSTAEIKIFMYEKALGKLKGTSVDIEPLLLGLMAEGAKVWE